MIRYNFIPKPSIQPTPPDPTPCERIATNQIGDEAALMLEEPAATPNVTQWNGAGGATGIHQSFVYAEEINGTPEFAFAGFFGEPAGATMVVSLVDVIPGDKIVVFAASLLTGGTNLGAIIWVPGPVESPDFSAVGTVGDMNLGVYNWATPGAGSGFVFMQMDANSAFSFMDVFIIRNAGDFSQNATMASISSTVTPSLALTPVESFSLHLASFVADFAGIHTVDDEFDVSTVLHNSGNAVQSTIQTFNDADNPTSQNMQVTASVAAAHLGASVIIRPAGLVTVASRQFIVMKDRNATAFVDGEVLTTS